MLCTSNMNGYKQWQQLFDESVAQIWKEEPISMLKNLSMIVFCLNREIKSVQNNLEINVQSLRNQLCDNLRFANNNMQIKQDIPLNKATVTVQSKLCQTSQRDSGDPVCSNILKEQSSNNSLSIIISDEDLPKSDQSTGSPEIKKNRRCYRYKQKFMKKCKENDSTNITSTLIMTAAKTLQSRNNEENAAACSLNLLDPFPVQINSNENCSRKALPFVLHKPFQSASCTPKKPDSDLDLSVIESTPVIKQISMRTREIKKGLKDKKLTYMFPSKDQEANNSLEYQNFSNQETQSVMGITHMVNYLNNDISAENTASNRISNCPDLEENTSLNSAIFEDNLNLSKEKVLLEDLNAFLAKAQNVPNQLEAEPVVRGKVRQKLPGWTCKDCEKFYRNQGLTANEILALTKKCTKHRGYYRPREDTMPGFWDLNLCSQESENT